MVTNNEAWKRLIVEGFCQCKNPDKIVITDEVDEETFDMCLKCNLEIEDKAEEQVQEELDMTSAPEIELQSESDYEQDRYEEQTEDRMPAFGY